MELRAEGWRFESFFAYSFAVPDEHPDRGRTPRIAAIRRVDDLRSYELLLITTTALCDQGYWLRHFHDCTGVRPSKAGFGRSSALPRINFAPTMKRFTVATWYRA